MTFGSQAGSFEAPLGEGTEGKAIKFRRSKDQRQVLWNALHANGGELPPLTVRKELARKLGMSNMQVYKWFWEVFFHKKQKNAAGEAEDLEFEDLTIEQLY